MYQYLLNRPNKANEEISHKFISLSLFLKVTTSLNLLSIIQKEENVLAFLGVMLTKSVILDILFLSNHNIHKSLCGLCFWASDPLIERF